MVEATLEGKLESALSAVNAAIGRVSATLDVVAVVAVVGNG